MQCGNYVNLKSLVLATNVYIGMLEVRERHEGVKVLLFYEMMSNIVLQCS